ncbi:hypothetical protein VT03_01025 [Planctomyces sp. SH-PL14]|nr:hypothetical protein VT03_01025 [Planctomyces sp. SH-PL14]
MHHLLIACPLAVVLFLTVGCRTTWAQEASGQQPANGSSDQETVKAWNAFYQSDAENAYRFVLQPGDIELRLDPTPILRWTNPLEQGDIHGAVYVWRKGGRPLVVGQLFSYLNNRGGRVYCHAVHSLARDGERLTGSRDGKVFWTPDSPGVQMHDLPMAPAPAASRNLRLTQMKSFSRRFSAYTEEASRGKRNLRLLTTPLDRFPENALEEPDGALFSLVVGNDPEVILVLETKNSAAEGEIWQYGLIQSTRSTSVALLDDKEVWRYDANEKTASDRSSVYLSVHGIATLPLEAPRSPAD